MVVNPPSDLCRIEILRQLISLEVGNEDYIPV